MPIQVASSSIFRLALKTLCSTCNYLYLFERIFSSSLQRWFSCSFCVFLCYTLEGLFHKKNLKKASGVIIVGSGSENVYFIFYWKEIIGNFLTNYWLDMDLRRSKKYGYVDIGKLLQTFSGAWKVKHFFHELF